MMRRACKVALHRGCGRCAGNVQGMAPPESGGSRDKSSGLKGGGGLRLALKVRGAAEGALRPCPRSRGGGRAAEASSELQAGGRSGTCPLCVHACTFMSWRDRPHHHAPAPITLPP